MYVRSKGLNGYRGMAALEELSPNDPSLQNPIEGTVYYGPSTEGILRGPYAPEQPPIVANLFGSGVAFSTWLGQNLGTVALGVGAVFALMAFAKAGR